MDILLNILILWCIAGLIFTIITTLCSDVLYLALYSRTLLDILIAIFIGPILWISLTISYTFALLYILNPFKGD